MANVLRVEFMESVSENLTDNGGLTTMQWVLRGMRQLLSLPAFILMISFFGFGGLTSEAGLTVGQAMFLAVTTWALPSAVVVAGAILNEVPFYATVFAVMLASVRLMPMTMSLIPILRTEDTRTWHLLLVSNFVAVTAWVYAMNRLPDMPRRGRLPFFAGLGTALALSSMMIAGISHSLAADIPPVASAALLFLMPIYFLVSMTQASKRNAEYLAIILGLVFGPVFHLITPDTDLLWCGLVAGTLAYGIGRLVERRNNAA